MQVSFTLHGARGGGASLGGSVASVSAFEEGNGPIQRDLAIETSSCAMQQRPSTSGLGRAAVLLVVLTICCRRFVEAFLVPPATTPAAARAAARAVASSSSSPSLPSGLWLSKRGSSSGSGGRLYARISEKPGDKADREQEGEQGLPVLGGSGAGGGDEVPKLTRQQEEVGIGGAVLDVGVNDDCLNVHIRTY